MATKKTATLRAFVALDLDPMSLRRVVRVADRLRMGSGAPSAIQGRPASADTQAGTGCSRSSWVRCHRA